MSKSSLIRATLALGLIGAVVFGFQNCQGMSSSFSSFSRMDNPDTPPNHPLGPFVEEKKVETSSQAILADRHFINALFTDIFGARYNQLDGDRIRTNPEEFGGSCSVYEDYRVRNATGTLVSGNPENACTVRDTPDFLDSPAFPQATAVRGAMLVQVCHDLTLDPTALANALAHLNAGTIPAATDEHVLKTFRLFYRSQPAPRPAVLGALKGTLPAQVNQASDWAPLIYALCTSSEWQIL